MTLDQADFLDLTPKPWSVKGENDKLDFIKLKNVGSSKDLMKKMKIQATRIKYIQIIYVVKDSYLKHIKTSYSSIIGR